MYPLSIRMNYKMDFIPYRLFFNALATQLLFVFPGPPDVVSTILGGCIVIPCFFLGFLYFCIFFAIRNRKQIQAPNVFCFFKDMLYKQVPTFKIRSWIVTSADYSVIRQKWNSAMNFKIEEDKILVHLKPSDLMFVIKKCG